MSSLTTLARPYAKAAFELANSDSNLAAWDDMLSAVAIITADEGMANWLQSPPVVSAPSMRSMASTKADCTCSRFETSVSITAVRSGSSSATRLPASSQLEVPGPLNKHSRICGQVSPRYTRVNSAKLTAIASQRKIQAAQQRHVVRQTVIGAQLK